MPRYSAIYIVRHFRSLEKVKEVKSIKKVETIILCTTNFDTRLGAATLEHLQ